MSSFFIRWPIFAIVISIIIVILGGLSLLSLPIAQYPQISPPTVNLSTTYTGANATIVNQTVAQVIEDQLKGVDDMSYMSSTSSNDGSYSLSVVFSLDSDAIQMPSTSRTTPIWPRTACPATYRPRA